MTWADTQFVKDFLGLAIVALFVVGLLWFVTRAVHDSRRGKWIDRRKTDRRSGEDRRQETPTKIKESD